MSTEELKMRLKDALSVIREKERDLIIAAEIGQQLVAANTSLVSEYEALLNRTSHTPSPATTTTTTTTTTTPRVPPAQSSAVRASKRASMSLSMSRLDGRSGGGGEEDVGVVQQERAPGAPPVAEEGAGVGGLVGEAALVGEGVRVKRKSSNGIYEYVSNLERANA
ncbi:hypothetical protein HDU67_004314, partial [Dinochytrium kinnereticum]